VVLKKEYTFNLKNTLFNHFVVFSVFTQKAFSPIKHNILIHSQKTYILLA